MWFVYRSMIVLFVFFTCFLYFFLVFLSYLLFGYLYIPLEMLFNVSTDFLMVSLCIIFSVVMLRTISQTLKFSVYLELVLLFQSHEKISCDRTEVKMKEYNSNTFFFLSFCLFRATPMALGGSQARGRIGAVASGLRHSKAGPEHHLQPTPQLTTTLDP